MKKIITLFGIAISLISCTAESVETKDNPYHMMEIKNEGGSPQYWILRKGECNAQKYNGTEGENFFIMAKIGDQITAFGFGHHEDNSHNYGAPDVDVKANITIFSDGKIVTPDTDNGVLLGTHYVTYTVK